MNHELLKIADKSDSVSEAMVAAVSYMIIDTIMKATEVVMEAFDV